MRGSKRSRHGHTRRGWSSATYNSWSSAWSRCSHITSPNYQWYGGKGITVCDRWRSFALFLADMGERPPGTSLDRINSNGDYEPGNCRWATATEQNNYKRKLSYSQVRQIRWLKEMGYSNRHIGRMYTVSERYIRQLEAGIYRVTN